eukprot:5470521-Amphidinium_carterae.1
MESSGATSSHPPGIASAALATELELPPCCCLGGGGGGFVGAGIITGTLAGSIVGMESMTGKMCGTAVEPTACTGGGGFVGA